MADIITIDPAVFLERAIALAVANVRQGVGGPFGCVITRDGVIVAEGANQVTLTADPTAHAEIVAIRAACRMLGSFQLTGCELYSSCEPCPMCLGAIYWSRPERVYFAASREDAARAGFDDELIYEELRLPLSDRRIPTAHLPVGSFAEPFDLWRTAGKVIRY